MLALNTIKHWVSFVLQCLRYVGNRAKWYVLIVELIRITPLLYRYDLHFRLLLLLWWWLFLWLRIYVRYFSHATCFAVFYVLFCWIVVLFFFRSFVDSRSSETVSQNRACSREILNYNWIKIIIILIVGLYYGFKFC